MSGKSNTYRLNLIQKISGKFLDEIIYQKIISEVKDFKKKPDSFFLENTYVILNWLDYVVDGDINTLKEKSIKDIIDEYNIWFNKFNENYSSNNYLEKNEILFDYRVNREGFYWVNLNRNRDIETSIRMDNCGRVNHNHTLIELREVINNHNLSRVLVVADRNGGIFQIKGKSNHKPDKIYYDYIFDFLLNFEPVTKIVYQFHPENDFKLTDLNHDQIKLLKNKKPHLFSKPFL
jgi:hypothetical protein